MKVSVWSYLEEYQQEKDDILKAVESVFESGRLILGDNVSSFENEFSNYCGAGYGVGVNSGTDALFLSLKALNIGKGDEVITVANTAVPTVSAIVSTGAKPVFCDIDPNSYLMDVNLLPSLITKNTRCILPVHLFGQCVDMDVVTDIAEKNDLFVVEDCAQSHGAEYKRRKAGSMSDCGAFSFYPTKLLGGYGDGGMVVTKDSARAEQLKRLRFYGMEGSYYAVEHGYNSRLDELHAAILRFRLKKLDGYISRRRALAEMYDERLSQTGLTLPAEEEWNFHAYYLYVCRHEKRDTIINALKERDIFVNISYPWPIHTMKAYEALGYKQGDLPHTELAANQIFSLPMYPLLGRDQQEYVIDVLKAIVQQLD
jgi:aminotransferase EvaB